MSEETPDGTPKGDLEARLSDHILRLVGNLDPGKTICPSDVARAEREEDWRPLMKPIRRCAQRLAREGRIAIYRKGKPVDPETFKGVIRLGLP